MAYAAVAMVFIAICPFGVPVGLLLMLWRQKRRHKLYSEEEGETEGEKAHPASHFLKSMFMQYAPHAYHFEVVHMVRRAGSAS